MPNHRLHQALERAGLEPQQLADELQVDVKTIERWLHGRTPYDRNRRKLARRLNTTVYDLWPHLAPVPESTLGAEQHTAAVYPSINSPQAPDWRVLLTAATETIELLDLTHEYILEDLTTTRLLFDKAATGCQIRLIYGHHTAAEHQRRAAETDRDPTDYPPANTRSALYNLAGAGDPIEVRATPTPGNNTILRADAHLLAIPHLYAVPTADAPVLHLQAGTELFDRFHDHYQAIWDTGVQMVPGSQTPTADTE